MGYQEERGVGGRGGFTEKICGGGKAYRGAVNDAMGEIIEYGGLKKVSVAVDREMGRDLHVRADRSY